MDLAEVVFEKKARRYTVNLFGQTFVGFIQPKMKVRDMLDSLYETWGIHTVTRLNFCLLATGSKAPIPEAQKIDKLLAPKNPKYVIGCRVICGINAPDLGQGKSLSEVFPLSDAMGAVLQKIFSPLGVDTASFFIQVEGTTVNLNDFITPLASISFGEFLASASNTLTLTTSQPIPFLTRELEEETRKARMMASDTTGKKRKLKTERPPSKAEAHEDLKQPTAVDRMRAHEKGAEMKKAARDKGFAEQEGQTTASNNESQAPPEEINLPKSAHVAEPRPSTIAGPSLARPAPISTATSESAPARPMSVEKAPYPPSQPIGTAEKDESIMTDSKYKLGADHEKIGGATPSVPPTKYTVNMGMEYYSVMMEKTSYLFYIHLSQKELKIETEEGKVVYQTTFTFVAKKEEPPLLELKVYGEGFEVHPFSGKVTVMKDAINPPLIIFSVMPVPLKHKAEEGVEAGKKPRKQKGLDERHLHVVVTYEGDTVNHTVLGVTTQPKHYQIKIGPFRINVSKPLAMLISVGTSAAASYSIIQGVMRATASPSLTDVVANVAPGSALWVAIIMYFVALIKAVKPLKQTWESAFAAGKLPGMMK